VRIESVDVTVVAVPYKPEVGAIVTAGLVLTEARHVIIELRTDTGLVGAGEAVPRPSIYGETVESIVAAFQQLLVPPILGMDPADVEKIWQRWARVIGNTTAKAALDMACHDVCGQAAGAPLYKLLGGWSDGRIPLTMPIAISSLDEVTIQASKAVADGFKAIKLKVGKNLARDVAVVEATREAIGPDVMLYVDGNQGYDTAEAMKAAAAFARCGVDLFEEPVATANIAARVRIAQAGTIPLLIDESVQEPADLLREIAHGTAGAVSIRSPRSGITWSRKLVAIAETAGVPCLVGSHRELGVATAASAHLAAAFAAMKYPAELGVHVLLSDSLLIDPLVIEDGHMVLSDAPGLGVTLDPQKLDRYRVAETLSLRAINGRPAATQTGA
jgi:L-alanine-DL-glutamate epimerase-like enolase superfamily enzyme